jgi:hypothetical protein
VAAGLLWAAALALIALAVVQVIQMRQLGTVDVLPRQGEPAPVLATAAVFVVVGLVAIVTHSFFLCLTSLYSGALGSGSPRFDPIRAAFWWIESYLWAIRAALAFVVPPFLMVVGLYLGGLVFGIVGGVVWLVCALWILGDPISCLAKPGRLLRDLYDRLAGPASPDSRIVGYWSLAWGTARGLDFAVVGVVYIVFLLAVAVDFVVTLFARFNGSSQPMGGIAIDVNDPAYRLLVDFVVVVQVVADVAALILLAQITIELSRRQHLRERWVMSGLMGPGARPAGAPSPLAVPFTPAPLTPTPVAVVAPVAAQANVVPMPLPDGPMTVAAEAEPAGNAQPAGPEAPTSSPPATPVFDLVNGQKKVIRPSSSSMHRYGSTPGSSDPAEPPPG